MKVNSRGKKESLPQDFYKTGRQRRTRKIKFFVSGASWDSIQRSSDVRVRYRCVFTCIISRCLPPRVKDEKCLITLPLSHSPHTLPSPLRFSWRRQKEKKAQGIHTYSEKNKVWLSKQEKKNDKTFFHSLAWECLSGTEGQG